MAENRRAAAHNAEMAHDAVRPVLKKQYHSALAMLRDAVEQCPDDLWFDNRHASACWQVAYHVLFFTHLYLHRDDASFVPWAEHQHDVKYPSAMKGDYADDSQPRELPTPYTRAQVLDYWAVCDAMVDEAIDGCDLDAEACGFFWYSMGKLELQLVNIRHLQHHTAQLADRLRQQAGRGVKWVG